MNSDLINYIIIIIWIFIIYLIIRLAIEEVIKSSKNNKINKIKDKEEYKEILIEKKEDNKENSIKLEKRKIIYKWNLFSWLIQPVIYTIIFIIVWVILYNNNDKMILIIYGILIWLIYIPVIVYYQIKYFFDNLEIK